MVQSLFVIVKKMYNLISTHIYILKLIDINLQVYNIL